MIKFNNTIGIDEEAYIEIQENVISSFEDENNARISSVLRDVMSHINENHTHISNDDIKRIFTYGYIVGRNIEINDQIENEN